MQLTVSKLFDRLNWLKCSSIGSWALIKKSEQLPRRQALQTSYDLVHGNTAGMATSVMLACTAMSVSGHGGCMTPKMTVSSCRRFENYVGRAMMSITLRHVTNNTKTDAAASPSTKTISRLGSLFTTIQNSSNNLVYM